MSDPEFRAAFLAREQQERINTGKVASALVFFLMPAGVSLDHFVISDPAHRFDFLVLRLVSSVLAGLLWYLHTTAFGQRHYRALGLPIALLPAFFMTWMICVDAEARTSYYAGLNLVLLAISVVVHWGVLESLLAVSGVLLMYVTARLLTGGSGRAIFNDFYFITLTGVIVTTGNYFFNRLRFREFSLSYELDKNRKALEESNQKLMQLDEIKSRFFANISHELRTPLTLLIAPLEAMLKRFRLDTETKELLASMHSNGMRLLKLINDLLDLVRLESGRLEVKLEPVPMDEFIRGLASAARQVADDKRLRLMTSVDPTLGAVLTDRDKLEKIILNLVFNALKFTPAGGRVDLRAVKQADELVVTVADTGMGISEKNLPHVFDRFWQADGSSRRRHQGVGIGLALVKELVELQGGKVAVESKEGAGATFTVRLPYRPAEIKPSTQAAPVPETKEDSSSDGRTVTSEEWLTNLYRRAELFPALTPVQDSLRPVGASGNGHGPMILVADDEPDMLRFLKSQLNGHYRVLEAVDGQQAVEKAGQFLPDLILLDMMMPGKDGLQVCHELRQQTSTQNIPIVLLTARADEETKLAALSAGASDFLAKPFSTTELHVRIGNLVQSQQYQRKLSKQNQVLETTIEQLKDTELQLVQSEKLASLGRMSAGIIHEINNPLNFAATGLFTLRSKGKYLATDQQGDYQEVLNDVEEGLRRVINIVSELRTFTHPDVVSRDQVEVSEIVAASLRLLSNEWKDKVAIEQRLESGQTIWANKNMLVQVVVNLLQNSLDALKRKTFQNDQPAIRIAGCLEDGKSILRIRDNGMGIEAQHLDKIFDPFFTTKEIGQGMGLGLAICYRIVQDFDGRIAVRTEPGKFCEFTLEFPAKG